MLFAFIHTSVISGTLYEKLVTEKVIALGEILMAGEKEGNFILYLFPLAPFEY